GPCRGAQSRPRRGTPSGRLPWPGRAPASTCARTSSGRRRAARSALRSAPGPRVVSFPSRHGDTRAAVRCKLALDGEPNVHVDEAFFDVTDGAFEAEDVPGADRLLHLEPELREPAVRPRPICEVTLDPTGLVRRIEEDVL